MSLTASSLLAKFSTPSKSATLPQDSYVLSLSDLPSAYAAFASMPSNEIRLYDKSSLRVTQTLSGHEGGITTMRTIENIAAETRPLLLSSGRDATVKAWDERSGTVGIQMRGKAGALLSCDASSDGLTLAAGTDLQGEDASILIWDPRNPAAPLRTHSSTHSDDITALHFLRPSETAMQTELSHDKIFLSASSDGLVSISNASENDEDEAVLHVGNWGCSIAQVGWLPYRSGETPKIWAGSDMETFSAWSEDLELVQNLDIRNPTTHTPEFAWVTDYLIGCHTSSRTSEFSVFVGSNEGDLIMMTPVDLSSAGSPWLAHRLWSTGHIGVVRSCLWDEQNNVLLTGGEDSKLNLWPSPPVTPLGTRKSGCIQEDAMDIDPLPPPKKRETDMGAGASGKGLNQSTKKARRS